MAYKSNNIVAIDDSRVGSFANVTIQNNGFLEVNSSDGFQGTVAGYTSGGGFFPGVHLNPIDKFPFSSDSNATDVGDLTQARFGGSGQSSTVSGYTSGGFFPPHSNVIDKFPFASDTNASDVGNMIATGVSTAGQSSSVSGYISGGGGPLAKNSIQKFPFATDTNATDIGDLTQGRYGSASSSSLISGYTGGGYTAAPPGNANVIDKFPFSTDTNATDVGDLTQARNAPAGQSSTTHGYASGGEIFSPLTPTVLNTIEKFPFATDTNATDIGDLSQARFEFAGQSSTVSGYMSGGTTLRTPRTSTNVIDKFPFATDTNATDVGDLTVSRPGAAGQQD